MSGQKYTATHTLKKDFVWGDGPALTVWGFMNTKKETHKKGSLVAVPRPHRKHAGFCCNVAFLTKTGRIKMNKEKAVALYSLDFFKPQKDWFEPIKKV